MIGVKGIASLLLTLVLAAGVPVTSPAADPPGGSTPRAGAEPDVLLHALGEWARRSVSDLSLDNAPSPSRAVFAVLDHERYSARAVFGALVFESGHRARPGRVEVIVGDDTLNSSRFEGGDGSSSAVLRPSLVVEDVPLALARDLWLTSDESYKRAVAQWGVKTAALAAQGGEPPPPDWSPVSPVQAVDRTPAAPVDRETLRGIALLASERLGRIEGLRSGEVEVQAMDGRYLLADSEGTRIVQPEGYTVVYAWADRLRDDGVRVADYRQWVARTVADLPPGETIAAEVDAMGRAVVARADGETVEYYEGPVLFEGSGAADFLRYLVPKEISGTPPAPKAEQTYSQLTRGGPRLGRRLLPEGWSVVDDPGRRLEGLAGGYRHDREGVPGEKVDLVEDGYVRDLLMSRTPRADLRRSNGHARGDVQRDWAAMPSIWEVKPDRNLSARAFRRRVTGAMKRAGVDRILVVRRLARGKSGNLPRPTDAVWLDADGREEPALSVAFNKVDRRVLRDIIAAGGGQRTHPYLAPRKPSERARRVSGIPSVVIAPARLLVGEMELVFPGPDEKPHTYGPPPLTQ